VKRTDPAPSPRTPTDASCCWRFEQRSPRQSHRSRRRGWSRVAIGPHFAIRECVYVPSGQRRRRRRRRRQRRERPRCDLLGNVIPVRSRSRVPAVRWCVQRVSDDFLRTTAVLRSRRGLCPVVPHRKVEERRSNAARWEQPHRYRNVSSTSTSSVVQLASPRHTHVAYPVHARTPPPPP